MSSPSSVRALSFLSFLAAILLFAGSAEARVVINELLYHPLNGAVLPGEDAEDLQFIELYNDGPASVDLSGASFAQGVTCSFPPGTVLAAGQYLVAARNPGLLALRGPTIPPGVAVIAWTTGDLANGGETVRLVDATATVIDEVTYDDAGLWPAAADGSGASLELTNSAYDNARPLVWRASTGVSGTPGALNSRFTEGPIVLEESPVRGSVVVGLTELSVTFAEPVTGVAAANLVVDGSAATGVTCPTCVGGVGAGPWVFGGFAVPHSNPFPVALGAGAIQDGEGHAFAGDSWLLSQSVPAVVINELHYNPASSTDDEEFIEITNAGPTPVDISGWRLTEFGSPGCTFPAATVIQPGAFVVCAKDPTALRAATGYQTTYSWGLNDSLSNGGEPVSLLDASGTVVDRVEYGDAPPWPTGATGPDGNGPSLELRNPALDNGSGTSWAASAGTHGTPGAQNSTWSDALAIVSETPPRGAVVLGLTEISVTFSEPVTGVSADDLTVGDVMDGGVSALSVTGSGAGPYVFTVADPGAGVIAVEIEGSDILTLTGSPFAGDSWLYFYGLPAIVINELHYNPAESAVGPTENEQDLQFVELYNAEPVAVDLSGYAFSEGIELIVPQGTVIAPGGFVVIAANEAFLRAKVPTIPAGVPVVQWTAGDLANGGETVALSDPYGHVIDEVPYDDDGDWTDDCDGRGPSLELVNPLLANDGAGVWKASTGTNGTPGAANSVYQANPAPIIYGTLHSPPIPLPGQVVAISATVVDDGGAPQSVTLYYREDRNPPIAYASTAMYDDGLHGDGAAGDGRYGVSVPGLANGLQLDFYIGASDGAATAVAPAGHATNNRFGYPSQTYLCKFSNEVLPTDQPVYHILVTLNNKANQEALSTYPARKEAFDATFIDGAGNIWYNVTERYRGQSSLFKYPSSYRVDFPRNRKLDSSLGFPVESLQLNAMRPAAQWLGFNLFNRAGVPAPRVGWAHLRYPGINYDTCCNGQNGYWGLHVVVERYDNDLLDSQNGAVVPDRGLSSEGNLYRGRNDANFRWEGTDPVTYQVNVNGQSGYEKYNNEAEDFWGDVIAGCDAASNTSDAAYADHMRAHVDQDRWARYFALHMLMGNREGGLYLDTGDDYFVYFPPPADPQNPVHPPYSTTQLPGSTLSGGSVLMPWDLDSVLWNSNYTIWRTAVPAMQRFLRHNAFAPIFVQSLEDLAGGEFSLQTMSDIIDSMPDGAFARSNEGSDLWPENKQQYKNWIANRLPYVLGETIDTLTLTGGPWITHTGDPTIHLAGTLQQAGTHNITVNGQAATFSVFNGVWSYDLALNIGVNPVLVQAWDRDGAEKDRIEGEVWYNPPSPFQLSLNMRAPRRMINNRTLTIEAAIADPIGRVSYTQWNVLGTVSVVRLPERTPVAITPTVFDNHQPVPDDSIRFVSGWGSVSFTLDQGAAFAPGDVEVAVDWEGLRATRTVTVLQNPTFRNMSGELTGANLVWGPDETIRVTGNVTVPAGSTLTIHPGTLVQVNTTGTLENGTLITVNGNVQALGTKDAPIYVFSERGAAAMTLTQSGSASNANAWRGFQFYGAGSSVLRQVILTGAGNGNVVSHPRPPVLGMFNTHNLYVDRCVFADNCGMVFSGQGTGSYTIRKTLVSRAGIGGEFFGNGHTLLIRDSWFTGIGHAPESENLDGDHLHVDGPLSNQTIRSCIFNDGGDDGLDHNGSNWRLEHSIVTRIRDKAVSMTGGHLDVWNTLMFGTGTGIRGLASTDYLTVTVPSPIAAVDRVRTTIVWPTSIDTCGGNGVNYTDVGNASHLGCGTGNLSQNPQFTSTANNDYNPRPGSPALTAGPNQDRIGWLGFPYGSVCATTADCNDTNACTTDVCVGKLCTFTPIVGCVPCDIDQDCDDSNACTVDTCAADGSCGHAAVANGLACSDGKDCTAPDTCTAGVCGGPVACPGGSLCDANGGCTAVACTTNAHCSDGQYCNGAETCVVATGECLPGVAPNCDDGVACTIDACNETTDSCGHTATDVLCDDGNLCTDDACDLVQGCQQADNTAACDDGDACTAGDACSNGGCAAGAPLSCDDGVACTNDSCDSVAGCAYADGCPEGEVCAPDSGLCEPGPTVTIFQDGRNGYTGTVDTYLHAGEPDQSHATAPNLVVDGPLPAGEERQILLRFEDIFGDGLGQVPQGARIVSATLTLWVLNPSGDGAALHEVLVPWTDAATWNGTTGGLQPDGQEAAAAATTTGATNSIRVFYDLDVTESLIAWSGGEDALGWVFIMPETGADGWQFSSSEDLEPELRPMLTVSYVPCEPGYVGDGVDCFDRDECSEVPPPCDPNATCANLVGSFTCDCSDGYEGDGLTCEDVDECQAIPAPCGANATCTNSAGSYDCDCEPGYLGDGLTCEDIDECQAIPGPCDASATCANEAGSYECDCNPGYAGDGATCADVDECQDGPNPCDPNATCTNEVGSYDCACNDGFTGDGAACEDVDECLAQPCGANAECANTPGTFVCACETGYVGDGYACGECPGGAAAPCNGNGACGGTAAEPVCVCNPEYAGDACDECAPGAFGYPNCSACPACDDGNPCTTDTCDAGEGCQYTNNTAACDDDDECTTGDVCADGECGGTAVNCDDGDVCTLDACDAQTGCNHTTVADCCNGGGDCDPPGSCLEGVCDTDTHTCGTPEALADCCSSAAECDDGDPGTLDLCDEASGTCSNPAPCADDDDCDDDDPTTLDTCDPTAGTCSHEVVGCTGAGDCDDGDACTVDSCEALICVNQPIAGCCADAGDCDDGDGCTADSCVGAACVHSPIGGCCTVDGDCGDGDVCTADACVDSACVHSPIGGCCSSAADCDDGDPCTIDACAWGQCAVSGMVPGCCSADADCDDDDPTTVDSCTVGTGTCVHTQGCTTDEQCEDGSPCTVDRCVDAVCTHGEPGPDCCMDDGDCDDGEAATVDDCDVATGACSHTVPCAVDADCEDGNPCTINRCRDGACINSDPLPGCCASDADCAGPTERCADERCRPVLCAPCEADADCGPAGNLCLTYPSGSYCGVACTQGGAPCPDDAACRDTAELGAWQCQPAEGDCTCLSHAWTECQDGTLVWFSSCAEAEGVADDCGGRGCAADACCGAGTHEEGGACVTDTTGPDVVTGPDVEQDAGGTGGEDAGDPGTDVRPGRDTGGSGGRDTAGGTDAGAGADTGKDGKGGGSSSCSAAAAPSTSWLALLALLLFLALPLVRARLRSKV